MTAPATHGALQRLARPLRASSGAGWAALGLGTIAILLAGWAWIVRLGWFSAPYWVLLAWIMALVGLTAVGYLAWAAQRRLTNLRLAGRLEDLGAWRRGSLTSLLDTAASGTSGELLDLADKAQADDVGRRGAAAVQPIAQAVRIVLVAGLICLLVGAAAFSSASVNGAAAALWHPHRAWEATVAPVTIRASQSLVDRGQPVELTLEAMGRKAAILWVRAPGEAWRAQGVRLDSLGRATVTTPALQSDLFARLTSGGRSSDTVMVRVRLPVFLGSLNVIARYPSYLGLENEPVPTGGDTLILPEGTRLETSGEATARLASASWEFLTRTESLGVNATRFSGTFTPQKSGQYRLLLRTASGAPLVGDSVRLPIRLVPDSAPSVEIPVPGGDTLAPLSLLVPLIIDARDDHSITAVTLESRRISRFGVVDSARRDSVAVPPDRPDRAILPFTLDLNRRGLLPGDTVRYFARARDNTPRGQMGRSREFVLRLPTMSEVRSAQREATNALAGQLDSVTDASRRVERQTDDLARERSRPSGSPDSKDADALSYEEAKRAEGVAKSQEDLIRQAESLKKSLDALRRSAEAAGVNDSAWQRQLAEIRDQLDRALSPELRQKLNSLQQALKDLDAERTKAALEQLADAQKQLREALERSRELFRRAALEGDLANLSEESRELAREQHNWNQQAASGDSVRSAVAERQLAARTDSLRAALDKISKDASAEGKPAHLQDLSQQAGTAAGQMQQAAGSAQRGQRPKAKQEGEEASRSLDPLSDQLQTRRQQMQQEWRKDVVQAIDEALSETSRLAERQLRVQEQLRDEGTLDRSTRAEQAAIEEGVERVLEQVRQAGGKNALVPPQIGSALGTAQLRMQQTREAISSAAPNSREAADQAGEAVDALNAAAHQLLRARGDVSDAQSGSGLAETLERLAQLAQQQGGLGQQGAGLLPMAGSGAVREQLQRLAARQRALAQELQKLRGQGSIPGAGEMADEAAELSRRLEAGRLERQTVERQQRLFRRMLDAGRTLQGREEDEKKERQSTTATSDSVHLPPALRARLEDENHRLRVPTWEELQRLSPEERRLVVDYFRRLSQPSAR